MFPRNNPSKILAALSTGNKAHDIVRAPNPQSSAAIRRLANLASGKVEVDFSATTGDVRFLSADGAGLFNLPFSGDALAYAKLYMAQRDTIAALGLRTTTLVDGPVAKFDFGTRVEFKQVLSLSDHPQPLPVRGGFVHVFVDKKGEIRQVTSTIRRGRKPAKLGKIIDAEAAIAAAKAVHGAEVCEVKRCDLTLSSHETTSTRKNARKSEPALKLDPTYEVLIKSCDPLSLKLYLVDARSGKVVYGEEKLHFSQTGKHQGAATEPGCKYFPRTPDPKVTLSKQLIDYAISDLSDPTKLENQRFSVMVKKGGEWAVARAQKDGSFDYTQKDPEFEAVIVFVALNESTALQEKWGMKKLSAPIPVYVHDDEVTDNAYFDPSAPPYQIHIGVGSGPGGLRVNIGYDKMVERHEFNGHGMITIMTPGNDLPGEEGGDMHESTGDSFALAFEFTDAIKFATRTKKPFTVADVKSDPRIIGPYSMDGGIRVQRNKKRTPEDKTGEVHEDGLISGGAQCDLMEALIVKANDVNLGCETWGRMQIAAMALVPAHKVTFKDMLRALISADQTLNKGANRKEIEKAFGDHGIKLAGGDSKKKNPGKGKKAPGKGKKAPGKGKKAPGKRKSPRRVA